jgi:hypothetical protein
MDWIVSNVLSRFRYRLAITAVIIAGIALYLGRYPAPAQLAGSESVHLEDSAYFYQNVWLYGGFLVSFAITGFLVVYIFSKSFDIRVPRLKTPALLALLIAVLLLGLLSFGLLYIHIHPLVFHSIAVATTIFMYLMDRGFKHTTYFPKLDEAWTSVNTFDLSLIAGTAGTVVLAHFIEKSQGPMLASGFAGGAIAFQLIIANLVFDPALYRIQGHSAYKAR